MKTMITKAQLAMAEGITAEPVEYDEAELTKVQKAGLFLQKYALWFAIGIVAVLMVCGSVFAGSADSAAERLWDTLIDIITTWVLRLGGVVVFVGGIMFGLGWRSDDAEQKSRGVSTMVAGIIVMVVSGFAGLFFRPQ